MIAHIIPIKRMPRTLGLLSYTVPSNLHTRITPGQLVCIPLRKSILYGLVVSVDTSSSIASHTDLKEIASIVNEIPLYSHIQLSLICFMADTYGISYGSAAMLFAPPLQKRKLSEQTWTRTNPETIASTTPIRPTIELISSPESLSSILSTASKGTVIIVPEIADISYVESHIPSHLSHTTWHSQLSTKEQFTRWFNIRNADEIDVVIGTRTALFLPYTYLSHMYIYREESVSHKHWEQKPQYLVHDLIPTWMKQYRTNTTFLTYSPRFETYYEAAKETVTVDSSFFPILHSPINTFEVIDMCHEKKSGNIEILAERIQQKILSSQKDICLYINRKGYATATGCTNCAYISRCERCNMTHSYYASSHTLRCHYCGTSERVPLSCPDCTQSTLTPYGIGTEQVESYVRQLCKKLPHQIVRIDSTVTDIDAIDPNKPTIYIGTDMLFSHIDWRNVEICVCVQIDDSLLYPDYRATESVWHTVRTIAQYLPKSSAAYIQTYQKDHLLFRSLDEPERLYRTDLRARQAVHMPPYTKLVRLSIGKPTVFSAETEAERVYHMLERILTEQHISGMVSYPFTTSPTFYRGQHWLTILIKLSPNTWQKDIDVLLTHIPSQWRVDISPQSLLAP